MANTRSGAGRSGFWSEFGRCLGVVAGVVGFGLAWAEVESQLAAVENRTAEVENRTDGVEYRTAAVENRTGGDYPEAVTLLDHRLRPSGEPKVWLVDGFNVLHAVLLGGRDRADWWTQSRRAEVLSLAAGLADQADVWVVFDGPEPRCDEAADASGPREVFAASADEWLLDRVKTSEEPSRVAVVTADRPLVSRLERCGARIVSPAAFAERCRAGQPEEAESCRKT